MDELPCLCPDGSRAVLRVGVCILYSLDFIANYGKPIDKKVKEEYGYFLDKGNTKFE